MRQTEFFVILGHFLAFFHPSPPNDPKNYNFEKKKKCLEILSFYTYMCTINEDHMLYASWNIRCDRQKFWSFWNIFCPFSLFTTWKIKVLSLKKMSKNIIILHICTIILYICIIIWCMVPEIWRATDIIIWNSGLLPFYPPYGHRKSKFWKKCKKDLKILLFYKLYHEWQSYDIWFLRYGVQRTEFFVILDCFLPFYPPNNPKNQNFEKMKKLPGDIILQV